MKKQIIRCMVDLHYATIDPQSMYAKKDDMTFLLDNVEIKEEDRFYSSGLTKQKINELSKHIEPIIHGMGFSGDIYYNMDIIKEETI